MESSISDNDSFMQVDKADSTDEYDASEWQDKNCVEPFEEPRCGLDSRWCNACRCLFSGSKVFQRNYKHYYYLSFLRSTADRDYHLCVLIRSTIDQKTQNHRPSEVLRLIAEVYKSSIKQHGTCMATLLSYGSTFPGSLSGQATEIWCGAPKEGSHTPFAYSYAPFGLLIHSPKWGLVLLKESLVLEL